MKKLIFILLWMILISCKSKDVPPVIKVVNLQCIKHEKGYSYFISGADTIKVHKKYKENQFYNIVIEAK